MAGPTPADTTDTSDQIAEFRATLVPDLYLPANFVPWTNIEVELRRLARATDSLQRLASYSNHDPTDLAKAIEAEPSILTALHLLFAAPTAIGFADGRNFPLDVPTSGTERREIAALLVDLGLWAVLTARSDVADLLRVALIAADARKRGHRRSADIGERVRDVLTEAIKASQEELGVPVRRVPAHRFPEQARGRVEAVVHVAGRPVAAVTSVFQAQSGGNPQRVLAYNIPNLQLQLDAVPLELIVIADGRGLMQTSDRTLGILLNSVASCMTLAQAEEGGLAAAIIRAAAHDGARVSPSRSVDRIIESTLTSGEIVRARELPGELPEVRFTLARYVDDHPNLALTLEAFGDELRWERGPYVTSAIALTQAYSPSRAISLFAELLGLRMEPVGQLPLSASGQAAIISHPDDVILPDRLLVVAVSSEPTSQLLRETSRQALALTPTSKLAVVLAEDSSTDHALFRQLQATLPINVTIVTVDRLREYAEGSPSPRDSFVRDTVEQADLTKVSPFVTRGASPTRMFFGRDAEEATLLSGLHSNSVAVLGSRRIGKTSLLHHAMGVLREAGYQPYFGDCQTVRTWRDFGALASEEWGLRLPNDFRPRHLMDAVEQLASKNEGHVVVMLDEIDQLIEWDARRSEDEVPEPFFRALRTVSQAGAAQFVFSGERLIARKLWDPHSPHWNFCQPLHLRQLTAKASEDLLVRPLRSLQIEIEDEESFLSEAWRLTSGHPQLGQALGEHLVRRLNDRPIDRRRLLGPEDVVHIGRSYEFRQQYLETYWGQATDLERLMSVWLAMGIRKISSLREALVQEGVYDSEAPLAEGLRMLQLYGIIDTIDHEVEFRAEWFPEALRSYSTLEALAMRLLGKAL